jgi:hypothetical protein
MNGKALWVVLEAKPGKESEVEKFLQAGQGLVEAEPKRCHGSPLRSGRPHTVFLTRSRMTPAGMRI